MPTLSIVAFLVFSGFYSLHACSVRNSIHNRESHRRIVAHAIGPGLLLIGLALAISMEGLASGIFTFFVILMTLGSLIVLLVPLDWIDYWSLLPAFGFMVMSEIIFF